jgi:transcriptional regulator with XRE-family HTH domain
MAAKQSTQPLGDTIREARVRKDLSLRELARKLDVTPSYLSDIENNRRVPAEDLLRKISKELGLDFDDLMARAGRFGDEAVRYMMRTPAAGVLFRKLAEQNAPVDVVETLIKRTEILAGKAEDDE